MGDFTCDNCGKKFQKKIALVGHKRFCVIDNGEKLSNMDSIRDLQPEDHAHSEMNSAPINEEPPSSKDQTPKGAKSWQRDDWNSNSWSTHNMLHIRLKDSRLQIRWVRDDEHSKVSSRLSEGWEFVRVKDVEKFNGLAMQFGSNIDSIIRVKELVAMMIPKTKVEARRKFINRNVSADQNQALKDLQSEFRGKVTGGARVIEMDEVLDMKPFKEDPSLKE